MTNKEEKYWFTIEPFVHISLKSEKLLLWNSLTGKILEYSNNIRINNIIKKLKSSNNLFVTSLTKKDLKNTKVKQFVNEVREYYMGDLINTSFSTGKPIQMMPILKILKDIKYLKKDDYRSVGENVMEYLHSLSIYINSECKQGCNHCTKFFQQFLCCYKGDNTNKELDIYKIKNLFNQLACSPLFNVNILGADIFKYSKFKELIKTLQQYQFQKNFYSHYLNLVTIEKELLGLINCQMSSIKVIVDFPVHEKELKKILNNLNNTQIKYSLVYILQKELEIEMISKINKSFNVDNYTIKPFFNKENMKFFLNNIFIKKEHFIEEKIEINEIYRNASINKYDFGKLIILNDGKVHANVNAPNIGTLGKDSIFDIVYKEMHHGTNWRRLRTKVTPCKNCTYELLCPPLSNYEYIFKKNNLCHIWK